MLAYLFLRLSFFPVDVPKKCNMKEKRVETIIDAVVNETTFTGGWLALVCERTLEYSSTILAFRCKGEAKSWHKICDHAKQKRLVVFLVNNTG